VLTPAPASCTVPLSTRRTDIATAAVTITATASSCHCLCRRPLACRAPAQPPRCICCPCAPWPHPAPPPRRPPAGATCRAPPAPAAHAAPPVLRSVPPLAPRRARAAPAARAHPGPVPRSRPGAAPLPRLVERGAPARSSHMPDQAWASISCHTGTDPHWMRFSVTVHAPLAQDTQGARQQPRAHTPRDSAVQWVLQSHDTRTTCTHNVHITRYSNRRSKQSR
jgi:hypothetical protein